MTDTKDLAKGYVLVNDTQHSAGMFLIQRLQIAAGMHVLDVGCGTGNLSYTLAELVGNDGSVTGVDPSKERISIALQQARSNLSFHEGCAEDLSFIRSTSMDAVFVNSTFHWVQDQAAALGEFFRVLKPSGRLGISGGSGDFVASHEIIKANVLSREPYNNYPEQSPPKFLKRYELEILLQGARFSNIDIVVNPIIKSAKDGEAMINWLDTSSSGKTYGSIPLEMRPYAKEEMRKEWDKLLTEDGIQMKMELLVTVAIK